MIVCRITFVVIVLMLTSCSDVRTQESTITDMHLKHIGNAMWRHLELKGQFPPPYSTDKAGNPTLSWRVLILPHLGRGDLYTKFHLDEPWDSEHNLKLVEEMPHVYRCPGSSSGPNMTNYLGVQGEDAVFSKARANRRLIPGKSGLRDGVSRTICVLEVDDDLAVPWTKPADYDYEAANPAAGLGDLREDGVHALWLDQRVSQFSTDVSDEALNAAYTCNGNEDDEIYHEFEGP